MKFNVWLHEIVKRQVMRANGWHYGDGIQTSILYTYIHMCMHLRDTHISKEGAFQFSRARKAQEAIENQCTYPILPSKKRFSTDVRTLNPKRILLLLLPSFDVRRYNRSCSYFVFDDSFQLQYVRIFEQKDRLFIGFGYL